MQIRRSNDKTVLRFLANDCISAVSSKLVWADIVVHVTLDYKDVQTQSADLEG
jgi:hypothetical protein